MVSPATVERETDSPLCFDGCNGCSEDDHNFGIHFRAYHERLIAEGEATRDYDPNPCLNCGSCGRDGDGE